MPIEIEPEEYFALLFKTIGKETEQLFFSIARVRLFQF
jgi:hypothetical protein